MIPTHDNEWFFGAKCTKFSSWGRSWGLIVGKKIVMYEEGWGQLWVYSSSSLCQSMCQLAGYWNIATPSHQHTITLSQHHNITPSHHHTITTSHHHTITTSQHHNITPSHYHNITPPLYKSGLDCETIPMLILCPLYIRMI